MIYSLIVNKVEVIMKFLKLLAIFSIVFSSVAWSNEITVKVKAPGVVEYVSKTASDDAIRDMAAVHAIARFLVDKCKPSLIPISVRFYDRMNAIKFESKSVKKKYKNNHKIAYNGLNENNPDTYNEIKCQESEQSLIVIQYNLINEMYSYGNIIKIIE